MGVERQQGQPKRFPFVLEICAPGPELATVPVSLVNHLIYFEPKLHQLDIFLVLSFRSVGRTMLSNAGVSSAPP